MRKQPHKREKVEHHHCPKCSLELAYSGHRGFYCLRCDQQDTQ